MSLSTHNNTPLEPCYDFVVMNHNLVKPLTSTSHLDTSKYLYKWASHLVSIRSVDVCGMISRNLTVLINYGTRIQ
jgi:hypothetical protein